jgi:chemotaxis signal transduction protein
MALPLELAREVVRAGRTVRVPGARPPVEGLLGVRGDVVAVVDLLRAIDPSATGMTSGPVVVVQGDDSNAAPGGRPSDPMGLRVTSVDDLFDATEDNTDSSSGVDALTRGTVTWRNETAAILDPAAVRRMASVCNGGSDVG